MRVFMPASSAWAVARKAVGPGDRRARASAWRLLPLRAPPRMKSERCVAVTRVLPRRPVLGMRASGQVSWLSDRSTPHAFPARLHPSQWLIVGFVPDYSDGVAADSHRLPWRPRSAGHPDTVNMLTLTERDCRVKRGWAAATARTEHAVPRAPGFSASTRTSCTLG